MDTPPPLPPEPTPFAHQAAKLSWVCPILVFVLLAAGKQVAGATGVIELIAFLLMVIGLIFGIVALLGIPRHGATGVLAPAIVGIIINGLLLFIFVTNFMAARAREQQSSSKAPPIVAMRSNH